MWNKPLLWCIGILLLVSSFGGLWLWHLRGEVKTLTKDLEAATALAESRKVQISALQAQAKTSTELNIKQSTTRASTSTKLKAKLQEVQKEAELDPIETDVPSANPVQLDRLRRLVHEANTGIRAAGADTK